MKIAVSLLAFAAAVSLGLSTSGGKPPKWFDLDRTYDYESYLRDFGKRRPQGHEYEWRKATFESRLEEVLTHNADPSRTWKKGINHMSDWGNSELRAVRGGGYEKPPEVFRAQQPLQSSFPSSLPSSVDWRDKNVITPVKDQGRCGSCWAFASTATLESHLALATGHLMELSPQQLVSCVPNPHHCGGDGGCKGSTADLAYSYVSEHGMTTPYLYGYESYWGTTGECHYDPNSTDGGTPPVMTISGYTSVPNNNKSAVMHAIAFKGPLAVNVAATPWHSYEEGVYDGCSSAGDDGTDINHVVQLVGYGTDPKSGLDYWLVRNSWTPLWGMDGYILLRRYKEEPCGEDKSPGDGTGCQPGPKSVKVCGECGILYDTSFPTGSKLL